MNRTFEHLGQLQPRLAADFLDQTAAFAEHHGLMAFAANDDDLLHTDGPIGALFPGFRVHHQLIGQLLVQAQHELFAGHFRCEEAHGKVCHLVWRVKRRAFGHPRGDGRFELVDAVALLSRDHEDLIIDTCLIQRRHDGEDLIMREEINLVEREEGALARFLQLLNHAAVILYGMALRRAEPAGLLCDPGRSVH